MKNSVKLLLALNEGVGGAWVPTQATFKAFLAANAANDNPRTLGAMASPPTITTDSTTAPAVAYTRTLVMATPADLATVLVEGGDQTITSNFLLPAQATQSAGVRIRTVSRASRYVNADVVAFYVIGTTSAYRFLVDDQYVDFTGTVPAVTTGTGNNYIILTFASKAVRKITVECQQGCGVRRWHIKTGDSYGATPTPKVGGIALGDSLTYGEAATALGDGLVPYAADKLGCEIWPSGVGATSYVATNGGTRYRLSERIGADLDAYIALKGQPTFIIIPMGLNDLPLLAGASTTGAAIEAEANLSFDIARQKCPAALIFVVNTWDATAPSAVSADYNTCKAAIQAAVGGRGGFWFRNPEGTAYTKSSGVHYDTPGGATLGNWLNADIRALTAG